MSDEPLADVSENEELSRVLREIAEALGARGAMLTMHPEGGDPAALIKFEDPHLAPDTVGEFVASRLLNHDRLQRGLHTWHDEQYLSDVGWMLSMPVQRVTGHPRLVVTAFFGKAGAAVQAAAEAAYIRRRPFAVGYFRLWQRERLEATINASLRDTLDLLDLAVFLIDDAARLVYANIAGRDLLGRGDGLRVNQGRLQPTAAASTSRFHALTEHVLAPAQRGGVPPLPLIPLIRSSGAPLVAAIERAAHGQASGEGASAILLVVDPDADVERALTSVCRYFDLSPTETRLALLLAKGASTNEAAGVLRVSEASARSYLKQVFAKTGAHRQSDLMRLLMMSAIRASGRRRS